jgi:PPP family 3-phenylpropionic acid transporter
MPTGLRRYSLFYFFYYAGLGAFSPYFPRFVDSLGHSGRVLGFVMAFWYGSRVLGPPAWSALIARTSRPGRYLLLATVASLVACAGFTSLHSALGLCAVMIVFGFALNPMLPQFEAMTLAAVGERGVDYGHVRLWGSIGFLIVAYGFGWVLDRAGANNLPWLMLPLYLALVLSALPHRHAQPSRDERPHPDLRALLHRPGIPRFLLVALLMQMGFGAFYLFYTLHLDKAGHSGTTIGLLWASGVLSEIAMFWLAPRLFERFGPQSMLSFCLAVTVLRWIVTALFPANLALMLAMQLLHAFSFAVFQSCCMRQMAASYPGRDAVAGQSLLYSVSSGVGGVLGALLCSQLWDWRGGEAAFLGAAVVVALAWMVYALRPRAATGPAAG